MLFSTYLYSIPEWNLPLSRGHPTPIRIVSFEKPAITPFGTPRVSSPATEMDPAKLNAELLEVDKGIGLGLTSGRPNSPMLPRTPSRGDFKLDE